MAQIWHLLRLATRRVDHALLRVADPAPIDELHLTHDIAPVLLFGRITGGAVVLPPLLLGDVRLLLLERFIR